MKKRLVSLVGALALVMVALGFSACPLESKLKDSTWKASVDMTEEFAAEEVGLSVEALKEFGIDSVTLNVTLVLAADGTGTYTGEIVAAFNDNMDETFKAVMEEEFVQKLEIAITWTSDSDAKTVTIKGEEFDEVLKVVDSSTMTATEDGVEITFKKAK